MNDNHSTFQSRAPWLLAIMVAVAFLLAGCATQKIDWTARVGNYTFDQAVLELGPPERSAPLQDGTVVADWLLRRGYSRAYPAYDFSSYSYHTGRDRFTAETQRRRGRQRNAGLAASFPRLRVSAF